MRKTVMIYILLVTGALLLAAAPIAQADGGITGNWSGQWKCTPPDCEKPGGPMHGNINQSGNNVTGNFTLENTVIGTISGALNGGVAGTHLQGTLTSGSHKIHVDGNVSGNNIQGKFSSDEFGSGTFNINR